MSKKEKIVLLDAHAIIHRAYHALPDFTSSKGEPTGALYGLSAMLMKIINDLKPNYIVACYDLPEPTHRHEVYKEYKGGRKKTDDNLIQQLERSRDVFKAFGIRIYEKAGFEADDILGTIAFKLKDNKDVNVVIASGDMDTLQLVDKKKVTVYTLKKGINDTILYDEAAVKARFGFAPKFLTDYKGLRGDPSDNIIGIKGIGEKTATTLITNFGTLEEMYKKLEKHEEAFRKIKITPRIINLLKDNEEEALFSKELATIHVKVPVVFSLPKKTWKEEVRPENILALFNELNFRTLYDRAKNLFGIESEMEKEEEIDVESEEFKEVATALWIIDSEITNPSKDDVLQYANTSSLEEAKETIFKELKKQKLEGVYSNIEKPLIPIIKKMYDRGVLIDTTYLKKLSKDYHKKLDVLSKSIFKYAGEEFNINSPKQLAEILFEKMELSVKNHKKTGTGLKSTKESELEKMRGMNPIIDDILAYRELQKLLGTYIDTIPEMVDSKNRLHAQFIQTGTTTGRMSSKDPNLQNIPVRTELGRNIRNAFVPEEGFALVAIDYSQIELRMAAILSGDKKLVDVFKRGGDIHAVVAANVFNVPPDMVDKEMRRQAKIINFGILYGMGVNALKQNLGTDRADAQRYLNEYFKNFSGLSRYIDTIKHEATRNGYTETLFGRRRYFDGLSSPIPYIRASAERMAVNAPMQGTQADIIKIAMKRIDAYIVENKLEKDVYLLLQVHDELIFEIKKDKQDEVIPKIKEIMESILDDKETRGIPLIADVVAGNNWGEMKEL